MAEHSKFNSMRYNNKLVNARITKLEDQSSIAKPEFINDLKQLYALQEGKDYHIRLARGFWYFSNMTKIILDSFQENPQSNNYFKFVEIYPQNIYVNKPNPGSSPKYLYMRPVLYSKEEDYLNDLRNDEIFTKILLRNDRGNPYVPSWFSSMRREIKLETIDQQRSPEHPTIYQYKYSFFDKYGVTLDEGDWIVIKQSNRSLNFLFKIVEVKRKDQIIVIEEVHSTSNSRKESRFIYGNLEMPNICIYYQKLIPCRYYLHMLGIYLYNLFFLGVVEENCPEITNKVFNAIQNSKYFAKLDDKEIKVSFSTFKNGKEKSSVEKLQQIQKYLAFMYFKLTFSDAEGSYYKSYNNDLDRIKSVANNINELGDKIADVLKLDNNSVDLSFYMSDDELEKYSDKLKFSSKEIKKIFLPFHKLVFDSVRINNRYCGVNQPKISINKTLISSVMFASVIGLFGGVMIDNISILFEGAIAPSNNIENNTENPENNLSGVTESNVP